jgi:RNA polymerase sigma-70 factor (ECF subfamily)
MVVPRSQPTLHSVEPDARTLDACRAGDRDALERVLLPHAPTIERTIRRILGPSADVEDVLQQTFIAAIGAFPRFRGEATVKTWLTRIAVRVAIDRLRSPDHRRRAPLTLVGATEPTQPGPAPDAQIDVRRALDRLYEHLGKIGVDKRTAFVLHVFEGKSMEEVAALMGASRAATKSRVFWCRRELLRRARRDPALAGVVGGGTTS